MVALVKCNPTVQVAVGVVINECGEVLISQRPPEKSYSGLWEFPGGKLEANESVFQALQREFLEEVGIHISDAKAWLKLEYAYSDKNVILDVWHVSEFTGEPSGLEGQRVQWVSINQLNQFQFLAGNKVILEEILKTTLSG